MFLDLLQVPKVLYAPCVRRCAKTEREKEKAEEADSYEYGLLLPFQLVILVIGLTFASIAPVILPFAMMFFFISFLVLRTQSLYVFAPRYETGGLFWLPTFGKIVLGIFLAQMTVIAAIAIKLGSYAAVAFVMAPLPIATVLFYLYCKHRMLSDHVIFKSLKAIGDTVIDSVAIEDMNFQYRQPALSATPVVISNELETFSHNI